MANQPATIEKTWAKGHPSRYQKHDLTHFPDWHNIIVWDAFFNNLTAGLMVAITVTWFAAPMAFSLALPIGLTLALLIVVFDLLLLVCDLGDKFRFIHSMRVMHPTSPLSVGVWGLIAYTVFLAITVVLYWASVILVTFFGIYFPVLPLLIRLCMVLAFIGSCVVICYKGVVFSCTSQPGVKDARWLTTWMVADAILMGMGLYGVICFIFGFAAAAQVLVIPFVVMTIARCGGFFLLSSDVKARTHQVYEKSFRTMTGLVVYGACGFCAIALAIATVFFGTVCLFLAGGLVLFCGMWERYWLINMTQPH